MFGTQKVIAGVMPMNQYEVPYQTVVDNRKRSFSIMVRAETPDEAVRGARALLKGTGAVKFGTPKVFLAESV